MKNIYKALTFLLVVAALVLSMGSALADDGLEIVDVTYKGASITTTTINAQPLDQVEFLVTVKNELPQMITGISTALYEGSTNLASTTESINLAGNNLTQTVSVKWTIPWDFGLGTHSMSLNSLGKNFSLDSVQDKFSFTMNLTQNPSKPTVFITSVSSDATTISCSDYLNLKVKVSNLGSKAEEDVILKVSQAGKDLYVSDKFSIAANTQTPEIVVPLAKSTLSSGMLTVTVNYRNNAYSDSNNQISVSKESCLYDAKPNVDSLTLTTGAAQLFEVSVKDATLNVGWKLDGQSITPTTKTTYNYLADGKEHTLTATAGPDSKTWKIAAFVAQPATLTLSSLPTISVTQSDLGKTITKTITLSNSGNQDAVTGLSSTSTAASLFVSGLKDIVAKSSIDVTLSIAVPSSLSSGNDVSLGTVTFKGTASSGSNLSSNLEVKVNYPSLLKVTDVEINGDENGDLTPESDNKIEVTVKNDYSKDVENIVVTATLKDIDNDDIDEESEKFDLDTGDDDSVVLQFDLSKENLDEDSYILEIKVEGEGTDNNDLETTYTQTVNVERESHKLILRNVDISSSSLQCLKQTELKAEVRNVGDNNEDNIEVRVRNSALGLDLKRDNIELDKYSGNDNSYEATFNLELDNAKAGTYPLSVEVYLDGDLEDSASVNLEMKECSSGTSAVSAGTYNTDQLAAQLQKQLQTELEAKKSADQNKFVTTSTSSFRESNAYVVMLGVLGLLIVVAIFLGLAALGKRR